VFAGSRSETSAISYYPPFRKTPYAPLKRIAAPGAIATAMLYLASDDARFVTGAAFQIDGDSTAGRSRSE